MANNKKITVDQLGSFAERVDDRLDSIEALTSGVTSNIQTQLNNKVPTTRKVNGKALSADITLSASDVGASESGHGHGVATASANGFMSSTDKGKLDGIATGANKYSHPTYTAKSSGLYKVTVDSTGHVSATAAVVKTDITGLGIPAQDTTYSAATTSAAGLMSASDKSKLDGIATGATKITVDTALSSTSTNPVQNKVINNALANKADTSAIPTKTSQLTNDSGFKTTDSNTTYSLSKSGSTITLTGSDGSTSSVTDSNTTYSLSSFGVTATAAELNLLDGVTATTTELNYVDGVTSNIQTQLNNKAAKNHTHDNAGYYKLTSSDTVTDVHGDGYAYRITVNTNFSNYVEHIRKYGWFCFDLSSVLNSTALVCVTGFKVSGSNGSYTIVGDCTSLDVWYHFTLTSTTWPST